MIQTFIQNFESGALDGSGGVVLAVMRSRLPAGTITRVDIFSGDLLPAGTSAVFNLRVGGVQQWAGADRPVIAAGTKQATKSGLSIEISRGARIILDLESNPASKTLEPITLMIEIEDGESAGGGLSSEQIQDLMSSTLVADEGIILAYDDVAGTIRIKAANPVVSLTDAPTIVVNAALGKLFSVILGGNRTLGTFTGLTDGEVYVFEFVQDATGSRTITLGSIFALGADITAVVLSTAANKRDYMTCVYRNSKLYVTGFVKGY
jgi:hypothetical protein